MHTVIRRPGRNRAADDDGTGHRAQAVALDGAAPNPDRQANYQEQQYVRVVVQEIKEGSHDDSYLAMQR